MRVPIYLWVCGYVTPVDGSEMRHITLPAVARTLAHIHRFNGQFGPASVADHCIRVAGRLPAPLKLAGLMHDIGEAVTGDIASPVKSLAPDLVALEKKWKGLLTLHLLGERLGVSAIEAMAHPLLKEADMLDYADEVRRYTSRGRPGQPYPPYDAAGSARRWVGAVRTEIRRQMDV